ncbi:MAG: class I SAM-dependent methyltransferase [Lentisphaeraceae bacterium]|nr:class I SAM-dependent methyltransferase [Lentisphaeraceae bacterium]
MTNNSKKQTDFSPIAPIYDLLGSLFFGGQLHRSQLKNLSKLPHKFESILIIGGGTGKFLKDLVQSKIFKQLTYIDISPKMIELAKSKVSDGKNINFIIGDESTIPNQSFDLIITHYFLDCFDQDKFEEFSKVLLSKLTVGGYWSMVDFHLNSTSAHSKKLFVSFLYKFFKITCKLNAKELPNFETWFSENLEIVEDSFNCMRLLRSTVYKRTS